MVATGTNPAADADVIPTGVCPAPTDAVLASRKVVDDKYNRVYVSGPKAIDGLRSTAQSKVTMTAATAATAGYTVFPGAGQACNQNTPVLITASKLFVNCPVLDVVDLSFTGTEFIANGRVDIGSGHIIYMPNATEIYVAGCGGCNGGGPGSTGLRVQGNFIIGSSVSAGVPALCTAGVTAGARVLVIYSGPFVSGGGAGDPVISLCQTFMYMANQPSPFQTTSGGTCTTVLPCPRNGGTTGDGFATVFGNINWTAPNEQLTPPDSTHRYEDLAFWSEAGTDANTNYDSEIKGSGAVRMTGVYFLPNGKFKFSGQASLSQELDAQFISRRLVLTGQGTLVMKPDPRNAIQIPEPAWRLIR